MKKAITWKRTTALATCALMLAATAAGGLATMEHGAASAADAYTVDVSKGLQDFDGWGLSLSWWATEIGDWTRTGASGKEKREEIAEALFGKTGLDLNIARYNVGGGDNPAHIHMSDDRNTPGWRNGYKETKVDASGNEYTATILDDYVWEGENGEVIPWTELKDLDTRNDYRQLWVLDWIQNNPARAEDYISEFYSNSPPWWMTMTGCSSGGVGGGQNLDYANNQAFVEYFLDVYEYLTSQGFTFGNLQPFNESVDPNHRNSSYWGENGDQEGCYFSAEQKVIVLDLLKKEMEKRGLDVPYNWGDETNTTGAWQEYTSALDVNYDYGDETHAVGRDVVNGADRYTYHIYWYENSGLERLYRAAQQDQKELYMSEICWSDAADSGEADYDPESLTTGFHYTQSIIDTVKKGGVNAYVFWQGMEDMVGQMKGHTNYGLIQGVYYTQDEAAEQGVDLASMGLNYQDYVLAKTYYLCGQYTKYIRPGYQIVDVDEGNTIAAVSPEGDTLVIVKQNNGPEAAVRFDLNGFDVQSIEKVVTDKDNSWAHSRISANGNYVSDTLSARSVTTYIVHGNKTAGYSKFVDESRFESKDDIAAIKTALSAEGSEESELFFRTGFSTGGGNAKYFGDTMYAENGCIAFRFKGTGFGIAAPAKSDAGQFDIWVDADPDTAEATHHKDYYSADQVNGKTEFITGLEDGWHTVYMKAAQGSHGSWVNLDGLFLYSSDGTAATDSLRITSAAGVGGTLGFHYEVEGFDGYTLSAEYCTTGDWTSVALDPAETTKSVTGIDGATVRLRLVAKKDADVVYSAERVIKMMQRNDSILYFADCGTADPNTVATGAALGTEQGVSDQPYGADPVTGKMWGYTNTITGGSTGFYDTYEAMTSMMALENTGEASIEYKFAIAEAGTYHVMLGFFGGGDGWGTREETADINGTIQYVTVRESAYTSAYAEVTLDAAGTITVTVTRRTAQEQPSLLSLIVVSKKAEGGSAIPVYAEGASSYNTQATAREDIFIGDNLFERVNAKTFDVYYSDGTTQSFATTSEKAKTTVECANITINQTATLTCALENGVECIYGYRWMQEGGASQLYYNIDCGYMGNGTPPDDGSQLGTKQSSTHDREYGPDAAAGTSWGYVGDHFNDGINWKDDKENKWSIREGLDGSGDKYAEYQMTGFKPNEALIIEVAGHCEHWSTREFAVFVNDVKVGSVILLKDANPIAEQFSSDKVKADEDGNLTVRCQRTMGDGAQVGYIKVWSNGAALPQEAAITADKTEATRTDSITLTGLVGGATVYVTDENGAITGSFRPTQASQTVKVEDYLPADSYELHFMQAKANVTDLSTPLVVTVEKPAATPEVEYILESGFVREGDASVIRFVPHNVTSVTSLTLITPDGVNYNMMSDFFFRATKNGTYKIVLVSGKQRVEQSFEVNNIDELALNETPSATGWTKDSVTVTLAPTAKSGIASVAIDGTVATPAEGKYSFTATENGTHTVTVVTAAGFTYERTVTVDNIDKTAPALALELRLTADGIAVGYTATSASGGKAYVSFNGGAAAEVTELGSIPLNAAGKYEISFTNGAGESTAKTTYYVTYGLEGAQLATVTASDEGVLTVTGKNGSVDAKLFRAGEETAIDSMKAEKVGKYYLDITAGAEREIVVLYVQAPEAGGGIGDSNVSVEEDGGCGGAIAAPAAAIGAIVIACIATAVIFVKRRKNS